MFQIRRVTIKDYVWIEIKKTVLNELAMGHYFC
jgi:hypothetical protein